MFLSATALTAALASPQTVVAQDGFRSPVRVEVRRTAQGFQLLRNGQPYLVRGVGGGDELETLQKMGGNSIRTWGADNLGPLLDRAHALGLTVTVGFWMGHERHGFKYDDPKQVADQKERARQAVLAYRSHPAVLMWCVGNEMEGFEDGGNPNLWRAVNDVAVMFKQLDPSRPVMTITADLGGKRIPAINQYATAVDIHGINSYGGAASAVRRYRELGGVKPVMLTEFGPNGPWESAKTPWGVAIEETSTQKAERYRAAYTQFVKENPNMALGSYAFLWGHKQETTATWFGMLLPDGTRLASADAMSELWTGRPPANRVPVISAFGIPGNGTFAPGASVRASLTARDPESDALRVEWYLKQESSDLRQGGDAEQVPPQVANAVQRGDITGATLRLPTTPGNYRLFVTLRDGKGGGATANAPLRVQ